MWKQSLVISIHFYNKKETYKPNTNYYYPHESQSTHQKYKTWFNKCVENWKNRRMQKVHFDKLWLIWYQCMVLRLECYWKASLKDEISNLRDLLSRDILHNLNAVSQRLKAWAYRLSAQKSWFVTRWTSV